jgi:putative sterol carrier protein
VPDTIVFIVAKGKSVLEQLAYEVDGDHVTALAEPPAEPAVTFTLTPADSAALRSGELDLSVGFMRGQVKMAGDFAALLRMLPRLRAPLQLA